MSATVILKNSIASIGEKIQGQIRNKTEKGGNEGHCIVSITVISYMAKIIIKTNLHPTSKKSANLAQPAAASHVMVGYNGSRLQKQTVSSGNETRTATNLTQPILVKFYYYMFK
jgi:hypothetical protein